jgi:hypothetical protein
MSVHDRTCLVRNSGEFLVLMALPILDQRFQSNPQIYCERAERLPPDCQLQFHIEIKFAKGSFGVAAGTGLQNVPSEVRPAPFISLFRRVNAYYRPPMLTVITTVVYKRGTMD